MYCVFAHNKCIAVHINFCMFLGKGDIVLEIEQVGSPLRGSRKWTKSLCLTHEMRTQNYSFKLDISNMSSSLTHSTEVTDKDVMKT